MKKLLILGLLAAGLLFANMKLINQKIKNDSIIVTFGVDSKTFTALQKEKSKLKENTKKSICNTPSAKILLNNYTLIYNYKLNKNIITVKIDKGSCK